MRQWQLQQAKASLSRLVKLAAREGPQEITLHGQPAAVIVSRAEYERMRGARPSLVQLLRACPLTGVELDLERDASPPRRVDL